MSEVFVDSLFWIASLFLRDQWHEHALTARKALESGTSLVTTRDVLTEFLAAASRSGPAGRQAAVDTVREILADDAIIVIPQSRELFDKGLDLYEQRLDQRYSLADCISMVVMRERGIYRILTHDRDFSAEGFVILIR